MATMAVAPWLQWRWATIEPRPGPSVLVAKGKARAGEGPELMVMAVSKVAGGAQVSADGNRPSRW